ncbi:MAG: mechanosensitive ion channel domain-containing protein [Candidatus Enteromonas sp.]|nr:mechanosensitive ion channel domain-containing protein [Candidatus Enteromonas sp.]
MKEEKKTAKKSARATNKEKERKERLEQFEKDKKEAQKVLLTLGNQDVMDEELDENDDLSKETFRSMDKKTKHHLIFGIIWILLAVAYVVVYSLIVKDLPNLKESNEFLYNAFSDNVVGRILRSVFCFAIILGISVILRIIISLTTIGRSYKTITLAKLGASAAKYACWIIAIFVILGVWGVDTATLLASAGIVALVIGLGAQTLIADIIGGIGIVFEDQFQIGDIVVIDDFRGTVKEIGLSCVKIQDAANNIKVIRNNQITSVINLSRKKSVAVSDCSVDYDTDLHEVRELIVSHLPEMKAAIPEIIKMPVYLGVQELGDSGITLRIIANCKEADKFGVTRAMNEYFFNLLNDNGITVPYPQIVVSNREESLNRKKEK